jgi:hypothetical protein
MGVWRSTGRHASTASGMTRSTTPWSTPWSSPISSRTPTRLAIGPDQAGNLLEIIWLELAEDADLVIHAMPVRPAFHSLLPTGEDG